MAQKRSRQLEALVLLMLVAPIIMLLAYGFHYEMLATLLAEPTLVAAVLLMPVMLAFVTWSERRQALTARLTVGEDGVTLQGLRSAFGGSASRSWHCPWGDITRVGVIERLGIVQIRRKGFRSLPR